MPYLAHIPDVVLTAAKAVVEMHYGRITACSEGKDKGSTFTVELPAIAIAFQQLEQSAAPEAKSKNLPRILLVEDDLDSRQVLLKLLHRYGYQVTSAGSVRESLELSADGKFDIVISDLGLPDGNGLELMRQLKTLYGLPGIALSGYGTPEDIRQSRAAGFEDHMIKPVDFKALRTAIHKVKPSYL